MSGGAAGLLKWDPETGDSEVLSEDPVSRFAISSDDARVLHNQVSGEDEEGEALYGRVVLLDMETGSKTPLTANGDRVSAVAMDAEGTIVVTGDEYGVIRVGPITGEEPHLLLGQPGEIFARRRRSPRALDRLVAAGQTVRLWPMPDLSKPPLHTLPHDELIAKLKTLTNLRVVRDEESATGWKLTHDPFPGWETVPTW